MVEDFESIPHKAVSFVVKREKEIKEWSEQKLPKVLPGYNRGRLPGRSEEERGRDGEEEEKENRGRQVTKVVADVEKKHREKGKGASRCQANRTKNIWAKCHAKLGLFAS